MLKPPNQSKIVICGTARNVEKKLARFYRQLSKSFSDFQEVQFIVVESFSTDRTKDVLQELSLANNNFRSFVDTQVSKNEKRRTVRIASARNRIIEEVDNNYGDFDYVVMSDMDGVNRDLNSRAVMSCWNFEQWDGVFANQPYCYYDIWALRSDGWCENDCWEEFRLLELDLGVTKAKKLAVTDKMRAISKDEPWIAVNSAFGGIGIYRREVFVQGRYRGESPEGREVCEHVSFHEDLVGKGFKFYINPSFVNLKPSTQRLTKTKELLTRVKS